MEEIKKENLDLGNFLFQKRREKGLSLDKLSCLSGIEKEVLENLEKDNWSELLPDIYVRGYLLKIGEVLGVDGEELWSLYKKDKRRAKIKRIKNHLPFLKRNSKKRTTFFQVIIIVFFFILIGIFSFWQIKKFLKPPEIQLFYPENNMIVSENPIKIEGRTNASILLINHQKIPLKEDGYFSFLVPLLEGTNIIEIESLNPFGQKTVLKRRVVYPAPPESHPTPLLP
ncbi:helix-turn-helix domain-containing protein [bacterium]|nr:helix-turn-helix domain-containing protein [bacterium]